MKKTVVIWGASGGIGSGLVRKMVEEDWLVFALGRSASYLDSLPVNFIAANLSDPLSIEKAVMELAQQTEQIDWWIYAAGDILSSPVKDLTPEFWRRILDANLNGVFYAAHYSFPLLAEKAPLYILGAINERMRLPGLSSYAAAKAGVEALAEVMHKELKRPVVVVRPKAVNTALWGKVPFKAPPGALSPDDLAGQIWDAFQSGYSALKLDL